MGNVCQGIKAQAYVSLMKIVLQDNGMHARLMLVGKFDACAYFNYKAEIMQNHRQRDIMVDYISFRPSEEEERWVIKRADVPDFFDRCPELQSIKKEARPDQTLGVWQQALSEFDHLVLPSTNTMSFNCRSGIVACLRLMNAKYDVKKDFRGPIGSYCILS